MASVNKVIIVGNLGGGLLPCARGHHLIDQAQRQRGLGRLTPVEFELAFTDNVDQAAA